MATALPLSHAVIAPNHSPPYAPAPSQQHEQAYGGILPSGGSGGQQVTVSGKGTAGGGVQAPPPPPHPPVGMLRDGGVHQPQGREKHISMQQQPAADSGTGAVAAMNHPQAFRGHEQQRQQAQRAWQGGEEEFYDPGETWLPLFLQDKG